MTDNNDNIHNKLHVLIEFIYNNRDKLSEIYEMENNITGFGNPENLGNPGVLVVTRKMDNQVDIFYYQWSAMEPELQKSVIATNQNSANQFHLILIDNIINKSVMIGMEKTVNLSGLDGYVNSINPDLDPVIEE
jgi:hypothetical protein